MRGAGLRGLVLASLLAGASLAVSAPVYAVPLNLTIPTANSAEQILEVEALWDKDWFSRDSYLYNHDLARLCGLMASTVYAQPEQGALTALWEKLGGEAASVRDYHYGLSEPEYRDKTGYSFALMDLPQGKLVLVAVRGTTGVQEWISNLNISDSTRKKEHYHEGFAVSARMLLADLRSYLQEQGVEPGQARILLTGHSRGAAVADLAAAVLDRDGGAAGEAWGLSPGRIYAYTFATPNSSTVIGERRASLYGNIFNVINPEDLVPETPFRGGSWDYGTLGVNLYLPSAHGLRGDEARYARLLTQVAKPYERLAGRPYQTVVSSEEAPRALKNLQWAIGSVEKFYRRGDRLGHASMVRNTEKLLEHADSRTGLSGAASQKLSEEGQIVLRMHAADTYNAWLQAGGPEEIYLRGTPTKCQLLVEAVGGVPTKVEPFQREFPLEISLFLPGGEEVAACRQGQLRQKPHGARPELKAFSRRASFVVPEGERLELKVKAPAQGREIVFQLSTGLEANAENGLPREQQPLSSLTRTLRPGEEMSFLIDNRLAREILDNAAQ